jgi:hypothetical protein
VTRLLLDEMYPPSLGARLRQRGVDCVAALDADVGLAGASDDHVLAWATAYDRAAVTENVADFARLSASVAHAGLVLVPATRYPRTRAGLARLAEALAAAPALEGLGPGVVVWLP